MDKINYEYEFDKLENEYIELLRNERKSQLRKLTMELAFEIDNEQLLRNVVVYMATLQYKKLKDERDNYFLVPEGGVA